MDRQEQHSHRNCFLLHALEEESPGNTDQYVIDMLSESISEAISIQGIDRNQRLPRKKPNEKSRPLIVKSIYYNTRILISKNKKSLKGQALL